MDIRFFRKNNSLHYKRKVCITELPQTHDPSGREKVVWSLFLLKFQDVQTTFYQACTIMEALPKSTNCSQKRGINMYEHYKKLDNTSKILFHSKLCRSGFSRYIAFSMHLDIHYGLDT